MANNWPGLWVAFAVAVFAALGVAKLCCADFRRRREFFAAVRERQREIQIEQYGRPVDVADVGQLISENIEREFAGDCVAENARPAAGPGNGSPLRPPAAVGSGADGMQHAKPFDGLVDLCPRCGGGSYVPGLTPRAGIELTCFKCGFRHVYPPAPPDVSWRVSTMRIRFDADFCKIIDPPRFLMPGEFAARNDDERGPLGAD